MIIQLPLSIDHLPKYLDSEISVSTEDKLRIKKSADFLGIKLKSGKTFYGINTGFGSLCNVRIEDNELSRLQENLVRSHACGMGDKVPMKIVKLMLLLKIVNIMQGHSGIQWETVQRLIYFYNNDIIPVVYELGSLGASGDLAPLAHLALPLFGEGSVYFQNEIISTKELYNKLNLSPIKLSAKEGLGLLNGTQFMSAYGVYSVLEAFKLCDWSDIIGTLSLESFDGKSEPFNHLIHKARPHPGQIATAAKILTLLKGSKLQDLEKKQVQDPYSFRCMPQVHGASKDALDHIKKVLEIEINSATDNPLLFEEEDMILSGGNFHGQPLAINLDYAAIALAELANISERRTYLLVSGQRGLPPFLAKDPGLNSGMMIAQYTAAAIVSQNKQYCSPASVDSIVSSNGQEDHVSMGANAATKLLAVINNVRRVLSIELLCAAQALDFRESSQTSPALFQLYNDFREKVKFQNEDVYLHEDLIKAELFLR